MPHARDNLSKQARSTPEWAWFILAGYKPRLKVLTLKKGVISYALSERQSHMLVRVELSDSIFAGLRGSAAVSVCNCQVNLERKEPRNL